MAAKERKQWYYVEIGYETQGGDRRTMNTPPTSDYAEACRRRAEYTNTGYFACIIECAPPKEPKKAPRGSTHE